MHTLHFNGWHLHYNGDLSGDVLVEPPAGTQIAVPGELLRNLVLTMLPILVERVIEGVDELSRKNKLW